MTDFNAKEFKAVKQLVDSKRVCLTTDDDGIVIGSDRWVYSCVECNQVIGKKSPAIYKHFYKYHTEVMALLGLADL